MFPINMQLVERHHRHEQTSRARSRNLSHLLRIEIEDEDSRVFIRQDEQVVRLIEREALDEDVLNVLFQGSVVDCFVALDLPQKFLRLRIMSFDDATILSALALREVGHGVDGVLCFDGRDFPRCRSFCHEIGDKKEYEGGRIDDRFHGF